MNMEQTLNVYTSSQYNQEVEELVERTGMKYLGAILHHALDETNWNRKRLQS